MSVSVSVATFLCIVMCIVHTHTRTRIDDGVVFCLMIQCNGTVVRDIEKGDVIQLQGDQRKNVQSFMVQFKICDKERIVLHGF